MQSGKRDQIKIVEGLAKDVLGLKQELGLRRPLLIEFCGTPKAGKTTTINSLNIFLKRNGFRTIVISEMAVICPIPSKTNFFFNSWTLFNSLAETIKQLTVETNVYDIILVDRCIFDAMCWFYWLSKNPPKNPYINEEQYRTFETFLIGTEMWLKHFDLTYIFTTNPDESLKREFADLLTDKSGSIMNQKVLEQFNNSIDTIHKKYKDKFRNVITYDTTRKDPNLVSFEVTYSILNVLREFLTEKIGYFLNGFEKFLKDGINNFELINSRKIFFQERHIIENETYIQPVAIAVITNQNRDKVLILKKNETKVTKESPEYNRYLLYLGGHVRDEDCLSDKEDNLTIIKRALQREIKEELNESITICDEAPFMIYTPISEKSKKHLAICFIIEMDLENKKFTPSRDEFIFKSSSTKSGTIIKTTELLKYVEEFETWSSAILSFVFKLNRTLF